MKEEIHHNGGVGNTQLQSFLHSTLNIIKKKSTGKKRQPYNITRASESDEATTITSRYEIVTVDGDEFAVIMNGEGHLPIEFLELYDLLAHGRVPSDWMESSILRTSLQTNEKSNYHIMMTDTTQYRQ